MAVAPPPIEVQVQFPNHSYTVALLLLQGVAIASVSSLVVGAEDRMMAVALDVLIRVSGGIGVLSLAAGALIRQRLLVLPVERRFVFERYRWSLRRSFPLSTWILPIGRWGRTHLRATHGRLRGAVAAGSERFALFFTLVTLLTNAILGLSHSSQSSNSKSLCGAMWAVLMVVAAAAAVATVVYLPCRVPLSNGLFVASSLIRITIFFLNMCLSLNITNADSNITAAQRLTVGISVVCLFGSVVSLVGTVHMLFVRRWESRQNNLSSDAVVEAAANEEMMKTKTSNGSFPTTTTETSESAATFSAVFLRHPSLQFANDVGGEMDEMKNSTTASPPLLHGSTSSASGYQGGTSSFAESYISDKMSHHNKNSNRWLSTVEEDEEDDIGKGKDVDFCLLVSSSAAAGSPLAARLVCNDSGLESDEGIKLNLASLITAACAASSAQATKAPFDLARE